LRRFLALRVLNAVLIDRHAAPVPGQDKLQPLRAALSQGDSLIIFPEGTRQQGSVPTEFKSGLYHLAQDFPNVQLAPVYLENLHRSMPKGFTVPVPVICTVRFGSTLERRENEPKESFLDRARNAVIALS
jgi:1-acyl-sn-glycerol-3-phosphate acyltransferase